MEDRPPRKRYQPLGATQRITVMLPPPLEAALRREVARRNVTLGVVVAECLARCLPEAGS